MFTRPVFSAMAATGDWRNPLSFLTTSKLLQPAPPCRVSDLFEAAWKHLRARYRSEYVYKSELANRIVFGRHSPRTTAFHVELPVGRSIVDVAVFNGTSTAYEVKTEYDTKRRLETQTRDYLQAFDRVFVVTHPSFAKEYAELVDESVGVLALDSKGSLSNIKDATSNRANIRTSTVFRCLRRSEYVCIAEAAIPNVREYPNGLIARACESEFCRLEPQVAHEHFVTAMRQRTTDASTVDFVSRLPQCLRAIGYATPLSGRQRRIAISVLNTRISSTVE
jgi:hypothetical protein